MTLDSWLLTLSPEDRADALRRIAKRAKVSVAAVKQWRCGNRRIPAEKCRDVVDEVGGAVGLSDLRSDVWPVASKSAKRRVA